jgi:hypothetical protein
MSAHAPGFEGELVRVRMGPTASAVILVAADGTVGLERFDWGLALASLGS